MLQVALIYPEIPPNTGNIARTCAATNTHLHLVEPLGFEISDRQLKRAGIDYWEYVDVTVHPHIESLREASNGARWVCFSARGAKHFREFQYQDGDWLLFGSESSGLPQEVLANNPAVYIPMEHPKVRSLNLSVSAALGLFEARRQLGM
ncbi:MULTISPECIES: tRNA (cytidine(34)-2'-O)-methyltransferase [Pseudanabaena]|jgi:tRNA (cytidine/uridine-2'-O-)-methyltransferase|uniref:tRNA (cytidine(34)-2'-O)-methyltransferase n=1 Tax=Pseudanabaena TaxID=1152 RepID=UPI002478F252|nr:MULTISPECIES: tRNA (cytidine(34)-2'-O)-methyltransferase [Pseudanabaena]MEA5486677.1 tRNA (cytidine(34)-2'-O)-methyltransferase [Pseudanabaena sp. CCNP1317]WGS70340.1 tRNA (cytidine(34)-2'-O)-methyltransferase [Pseudanabaena galeata CCNP1313]